VSRHRFDGLSFGGGVVVAVLGGLAATGDLGETLNNPEKIVPWMFGLVALLLVASTASSRRASADRGESPTP
jgi:hypothetical protein